MSTAAFKGEKSGAENAFRRISENKNKFDVDFFCFLTVALSFFRAPVSAFLLFFPDFFSLDRKIRVLF